MEASNISAIEPGSWVRLGVASNVWKGREMWEAGCATQPQDTGVTGEQPPWIWLEGQVERELRSSVGLQHSASLRPMAGSSDMCMNEVRWFWFPLLSEWILFWKSAEPGLDLSLSVSFHRTVTIFCAGESHSLRAGLEWPVSCCLPFSGFPELQASPSLEMMPHWNHWPFTKGRSCSQLGVSNRCHSPPRHHPPPNQNSSYNWGSLNLALIQGQDRPSTGLQMWTLMALGGKAFW